MMTRRDFEAIAHTLDANFAPLALVQDFADMLKEQNPRFDRERFIQASTSNLLHNLNRDAIMVVKAREGK